MSSSWVQEGSVEDPAVWTRTAPALRLTGQDAGPYNPWKRRGPKEDEAARRSRRPESEKEARAAAGLRPLPGPFLLEHCPSLTNPAARRGPPDLVYFGHFSPLNTFVLLFMLNKSLSQGLMPCPLCLSFALPVTIYIYIYIYVTPPPHHPKSYLVPSGYRTQDFHAEGGRSNK